VPDPATKGVRLDERLALRPAELAEALGVSERLLREKAHLIPHFRLGAALVFPVDSVRDWLKAQAKTESSKADVLVASLRMKIRSTIDE
jgi:hypothetical protein